MLCTTNSQYALDCYRPTQPHSVRKNHRKVLQRGCDVHELVVQHRVVDQAGGVQPPGGLCAQQPLVLLRTRREHASSGLVAWHTRARSSTLSKTHRDGQVEVFTVSRCIPQAKYVAQNHKKQQLFVAGTPCKKAPAGFPEEWRPFAEDPPPAGAAAR